MKSGRIGRPSGPVQGTPHPIRRLLGTLKKPPDPMHVMAMSFLLPLTPGAGEVGSGEGANQCRLKGFLISQVPHAA